MVVVPIVDNVYGMPLAFAARHDDTSPVGCIMRV